MKCLLFLLLLTPFAATSAQSTADQLAGAWSTTYLDGNGRTNELTMTIVDGYFAMTAFNQDSAVFVATLGGSYEATDSIFTVTYEFDSGNPDNVGRTVDMPYRAVGSLLVFNNDKAWKRVDAAGGELAGAWQITGRKQEGEMRRRKSDGPRRTMKILSGTRFQWIAYNTETKEFMGTGGGGYTLEDGRYTEQIEFFSRDPERVGDYLSFDYKIRNNEWHHSGLSSKQQPIYETWGHRE